MHRLSFLEFQNIFLDFSSIFKNFSLKNSDVTVVTRQFRRHEGFRTVDCTESKKKWADFQQRAKIDFSANFTNVAHFFYKR